jgi:hypothetical protein
MDSILEIVQLAEDPCKTPIASEPVLHLKPIFFISHERVESIHTKIMMR